MPTLTPACHAVFSGNVSAFGVLCRLGLYRDDKDLDEAVFLAHAGEDEGIGVGVADS